MKYYQSPGQSATISYTHSCRGLFIDFLLALCKKTESHSLAALPGQMESPALCIASILFDKLEKLC